MEEPSVSAPQVYAPFSTRAFVIGLILCPLIVGWAEYNEVVAQGADLIAMSLIMSVVFVLMLLLLVNAGLRRYAPRLALTRPELMLIYTMNSASVGICGIGMMQFLVPQLTGPTQYETTTNGWRSWTYLVRSWAVPDRAVVSDFYAGSTTFFTRAHVMGWLSPICVWSAFLLVLLYCMYCIGVLLRKQWVESERLIFPIALVPLEITSDSAAEQTGMWRNRVFWAGFALSVVLEALASIHYTIDAKCPYFPLKANEPAYNLGQYVSSPPWSGMGYTVIGVYPLVIGMVYLLSLDVSFSCWFFYLLVKLENVGAVAIGVRDPHDGGMLGSPPYAGNQGAGAFVALSAMAVVGAWPHLKRAFKAGFQQRAAQTVECEEPLSYRAAFIGLAVSCALLIAFGIGLGITWYVAAVFFALFLTYVIALTRIRAEAGLPWSVGPVPYVHGTMVNIAGTHGFDAHSLVGLSMFRWFDSDWRSPQMPSYIEAMKIAQGAKLNPRHLTVAIGMATVVATIASWVSLLGIYYSCGASSSHVNSWRTDQAHYGFDELQGWFNTPRGFDPVSLKWSIAGFLVIMLLTYTRRCFVWWPFHPIGYAVANAGSGALLEWIWMSIFIGWLFKSITVRYGGMLAFRKVLPFFLGLILGDYAAGGMTSLLWLLAHMPGYRTFPI